VIKHVRLPLKVGRVAQGLPIAILDAEGYALANLVGRDEIAELNGNEIVEACNMCDGFMAALSLSMHVLRGMIDSRTTQYTDCQKTKDGTWGNFCKMHQLTEARALLTKCKEKSK